MDARWDALPTMRTPGLFVTGTDTDVGKTVAACLIADQLRRGSLAEDARSRVGVLKPIASGCRYEREWLVSPDAEALAHAADFDPAIGDLDVVCPIRFRPPIAPAVALERQGKEAALDLPALVRAMGRLDDSCRWVVVEGLGGAMAPIERLHSRITTMVDLMGAVGYPAVVVCSASLGTLNHAALTCGALKQRGVRIAGLIINGFDADTPDQSMESNRRWLSLQCKAPILAVLPRAESWDVRAMPAAHRDAIDATRFADLCRPAAR